MTGRTYKLPKRTAMLIETLAHEYREYGNTQGSVLAACAVLLASDVEEARSGRVLARRS